MAKNTFGYELECFGLTPQVIQLTINSIEGAQLMTPTVALREELSRRSGDNIDLAICLDSVNHESRRLFGYMNSKYLPLRCKENGLEQMWIAASDGTIRNDSGRGMAHEIISPLLYGLEGLLIASRVMKALVRAGARVNISCGTHVTMGVKNCNARIARMSTKKQNKCAGKIVEAYLYFHNVFDSLVSASRRYGSPSSSNAYTMNRPNVYTTYGMGTGEHYNRMVSSGVGRGTVNIGHFASKGVIEFRQHNGSLNGLKMMAWTQLLTKLISWSINENGVNFGKDLRTFEPSFSGLMEMLNVGSDLRTTLESRVASTRGFVNSNHHDNMMVAHRAFIGGIEN